MLEAGDHLMSVLPKPVALTVARALMLSHRGTARTPTHAADSLPTLCCRYPCYSTWRRYSEEDLALQVAAPPRCVIFRLKLEEAGNVPGAISRMLPLGEIHMFCVGPHPRAVSIIAHFFPFCPSQLPRQRLWAWRPGEHGWRRPAHILSFSMASRSTE